MAERWKIEELVFDKITLMVVAKIIKKGLIKTIDFPISTGKEAVVFRVTTDEGFGALKIYKIETTSFINRLEYLQGDYRFKHIKKNLRDIVYLFTKKEYKNLKVAEKAKVNAPLPYYQEKNVLLMSFLGENGVPYKKLLECKELKKDYFFSILEDIKKLYNAGIVHSDVSEFNILIGDKPYLIDFAQGVVKEHVKANEFLERDVRNVLNFFKKKIKLSVSFDWALNYVKS